MTQKTTNQRAWFLVLPVLVLVAFSSIIPMMTVVNYSFQDSFGGNEFFWVGLEWYRELLGSERLWDALGRQLLFSTIILILAGIAAPTLSLLAAAVLISIGAMVAARASASRRA